MSRAGRAWVAPREDAGAVVVLYGLLTLLLFATVAIVVDLGSLRADTRANQKIADAAATSGALDLDPLFGGTPIAGCAAAWSYFLANTPDAPQDASNPCAPFASMTTCLRFAATLPAPISVTGTAGPYDVTITYPVLDGSPLMKGRLKRIIDGEPCERIGVVIARSRGYLFGAVVGAFGGASSSQAVARATSSGGQGEPVALVVLDPTGCQSLVAKGQAEVFVRSANSVPGMIAVDSSATETSAAQQERNCTSTTYAIDAFGAQNSKIQTEDAVDEQGLPVKAQIFAYALMPGQGNARAYEEIDVVGGRLTPRPTPGERVTRAPIDWLYNCKPQNDCPWFNTTLPFVDDLRSFVGAAGAPAGFLEYPVAIPGAKCNLAPSDPPLTLAGNWWVNCASFDVSNAVTFAGGNVLFQGTVNVGSAGRLSINAGSSDDRWVYIRSGDFVKNAQAALELDKVFVYMGNGRVNFGAGSGSLTWIAPLDGSFEDLALWSESSAQHDFGGQTTLTIEGTFFTPNAFPFRFTGQGAQYQTHAQFVTYRLEITGQGQLQMLADPERTVLIPLQGIRLIR